MIITVESAATRAAEAARHSLADLARGWGCEITEAPGQAPPVPHPVADGKAAGPVSMAALVLSVPSAALAALDLAGGLAARRRASDLISHARRLAGQNVTMRLVTRATTIDIRALDPDQLLDLAASHDPAEPDTQPPAPRPGSPPAGTDPGPP